MFNKIVIIGPESTGKSTLCEKLAKHYQTLWCQEYAREYLLKNGTNYSYDDLLTIAKGQLALEDTCSNDMDNQQRITNNRKKEEFNNPKWPTIVDCQPSTINNQPLFLDTDMYVMKVWCEFVYGQCHTFILNEITARKYDLYLLCKPDIPWVKDELREYPDLETRDKLYHIYKDLLVNQSTPWVEISGDYDERLQKGIDAVEMFLK